MFEHFNPLHHCNHPNNSISLPSSLHHARGIWFARSFPRDSSPILRQHKKSVLLHAPLEQDMHVHIIANQDAYRSLGESFNRMGPSMWVTHNSIEICAYDITTVLPQLEHLIVDAITKGLQFRLEQCGSGHFYFLTYLRAHTSGCLQTVSFQ